MTRNEQGIPMDVLRELISLDADTGVLTWKRRLARHHKPTAKRTAEHIAANWNSIYAGKPALACVDAFGHLHGRIFNKCIYAHRAVFALVHGGWPEHEIDHINGVPNDNRPSNLRDVSHQENLRNMKFSRANTSGATGVSFNKRLGKWAAHAGIDGRYGHLGFFEHKEDAIASRLAANSAIGFHENHGAVRQ